MSIPARDAVGRVTDRVMAPATDAVVGPVELTAPELTDAAAIVQEVLVVDPPEDGLAVATLRPRLLASWKTTTAITMAPSLPTRLKRSTKTSEIVFCRPIVTVTDRSPGRS